MRAASDPSSVENKSLLECMDRLQSEKDGKRPLSTYRLQLNAGFRFEDARQLLPYLHAMGVTHCYVSPILRAREGSQHGYDITNHNEINPEIGTLEEFAALVREMKALRMGLILDVVPNHMGVGFGTNPWWQDVLENGQASEFADYFDIDWDPLKTELRDKVLLPVLGGSYGEELEAGRLRLVFDDRGFGITYYDKRFPVDPATYPIIFDQLGDAREFRSDEAWKVSEYPEWQEIARGLRELAPHNATDSESVARRRAEVGGLRERLVELQKKSANVRELVSAAIEKVNGKEGEPHSFDVLHRLLEAQAWRLAHWRVSTDEINYRRFFDINDLVGLRMENPAVFGATHQLIRKLLADGSVDGVRLDHPDGLFNPVQYFTQLQMLYAAARCCGGSGCGPAAPSGIEQDVVAAFGVEAEGKQRAPLYVVVEKILEHGEHLPPDWPVDGTVGYEFGNELNHLFINSRAQRYFTDTYHRILDGPVDINNLIYESKMLIMRSSLSSEVGVLTHMLDEISSGDRRARDFTRSLLKDVIRETIACFPVYRTYIDARGTVSERDRAYIVEAVTRAKRLNQSASGAPYDFLRSVLLLEAPDSNVEEYRKRLKFTMKFQQLTGPVMAKGLEDTVCYVYNRFLSANEVGGSPAQFGISLEEFHHGNLERARDWPSSMLGTSTHDSKRSEDVRARLNVLSEMPKEWARLVLGLRRANKSKKTVLADGRTVPDANEEYFLYQTLVGTWPLEQDDESMKEFTRRIQEYMDKAVHEAKVNLSWINQNQEYSDAMKNFVARILEPRSVKRWNPFLRKMESFLPAVQYCGFINSLAQVLLKLTSPGVPDVYRGNELWDFSLVDPDNRRPVDYGRREQALEDLLKREQGDVGALCAELLEQIEDGRSKMWTTMRGLRFRREHPELFRKGEYVPLFASDPSGEHVIAFARRYGDQTAITVAPRFSYTLIKGEKRPPLGAEAWRDTTIAVPEGVSGPLTNVMTGETVEVRDGRLLCREIFAKFPVALLAAV